MFLPSRFFTTQKNHTRVCNTYVMTNEGVKHARRLVISENIDKHVFRIQSRTTGGQSLILLVFSRRVFDARTSPSEYGTVHRRNG